MNVKKTAWLAWGICGIVILAILFGAGSDLLRAIGQGNPEAIGNTIIWGFMPIVFVLVGALILSKQPHNVIGWLLMLPTAVTALNALLTTPLRDVTAAPSQPSLALLFALWMSGTDWVLLVFPVFFIAMLFPTGRPVSPRWKWAIMYGIALAVFFYMIATFTETIGPDPSTYGVDWRVRNPIGFISQDVMDQIFSFWWSVALAILALLSMASLVVRYWRGTSIERQQIKGLLAACGLFALSYAPLVVTVVTEGDASGTFVALLNIFFVLGIFAFPIAIGISILRYRLWDIDILIRRTVTYALVVAMLAVIYFGSVIVLQQLFANLTGARSEVITVLSTLVIAALFIPLRNRIQNAIDQRFNRKKYDAQLVLQQFAETVRDETDLEKLSLRLMQVVDETMEPASISLWLKTENKK